MAGSAAASRCQAPRRPTAPALLGEPRSANFTDALTGFMLPMVCETLPIPTLFPPKGGRGNLL